MRTEERQFSKVLGEMLKPIIRAFDLKTSRALVKLRLPPRCQARVTKLARKCNEGLLTDTERSEYETYVRTGMLIGIPQTGARLKLRKIASVASD